MSKFCTGCGAPLDDAAKFCVSCGTPAAQPQPQQPQPVPQPQQYQQPYPAYPSPQPYAAPPAASAPKKKRTGLKILLGFVGAIVLLVAAIVALTGKASNMDYYKIQKDQVPSVKYVLGEKRKIVGTGAETKNGIASKYFAYKSDTPQEDIDAYYAYLLEEEGYTRMLDSNMEFSGAGHDSVTPGYHLEVQADPSSDGYTVTVYYVKGEIQMLDEPEQEETEPADETTTRPNRDLPPVTSPSRTTKPPATSARNDTSFSADDDYYIFGNDKMPSVKNVLGYRRVPSSARFTMSGTITLQAEYKSDTPNQDAYDYLVYLKENDGFYSLASVSFADPSGRAEFGRNSVDSGYMIVLTLDFDPTGYKLEVKYSVGEITLND
ncbi:MAG: zinc ribbon domain-containing protein [Oscillospiraceae bacterium]|nr:zinc ribbon domain-containing protein [Oscillospiraceae bacterium]